MTPIELAGKLELEILAAGRGSEKEITGIYCCDLLSIVMGRAKENDVWITVMGNVNAVAVAVLSDVSCILLSEGTAIDDATCAKAEEKEVCILRSAMPTYELSREITRICGL